MDSKQRVAAVGLAVGRGTGPELADVFIKVSTQMANHYNVGVKICRSQRLYHSYHSLLSAGKSFDHIVEETEQDAEHYQQFCRDQVAQGTRVIFRTAITAQPLYLVRQHLEAIKVEHFSNQEADIILVRDQAQGFYTGVNTYLPGKEIVSRTCSFSKDVTDRIVCYTLSRALGLWGADAVIESVAMVYKHHLFDGLMDTWAKEMSKKYGLRLQFVQPDTMNRNILRSGLKGRQVIIASNEYADIMEVLFMNWLGRAVQETTCSENVYLSPLTDNLQEYQTVHGSADDLVGKGIVNPTATIKAAAAILERHASCSGLEDLIDEAFERLWQQKIATPDQGGSASTAAYVNAVLEMFFNIAESHRDLSHRSLGSSAGTNGAFSKRIDMGKKTALVIVDFQTDFSNVLTDEDGNPSISSIAANIQQLLTFVRTHHPPHKTIFLRFLGDAKYLPPNWQHRNEVLARRPCCISDTSDADFIAPVQPAPGEPVFNKEAVFDAFLCDAFATYLKQHGFEHLLLAGLYGDVCVDSIARTAFQKGLYLTIISDCVGMLHLPGSSWLKFARTVYGARVVTTTDFLAMDLPPQKARLA